MFIKTKIVLAATLIVGSATLALAQGFDPNLANRYPGYAEPGTYGYAPGSNAPGLMQPAPRATLQSAPVRLHRTPNATLQSAPVRLRQGRDAAPTNEFEVDRNDRASSPYAGGGY